MKSLVDYRLRLLFVALTYLLLVSCKMSAWRASSPSAVIGENDTKKTRTIPIDELPMGREIFVAATMSSPMIMVKISDGRRKGAIFCSGVLLAGEGDLPRVLTNSHCLMRNVKKESPDLIRDTCANTVVYFDKYDAQQGEDSIVPKLERTCKRGSLRTSFEGGVAVFTLSSALPARYPGIEIWSDNEFPANRKVFVIYYPSNPHSVEWIEMVKIEGGLDGKAPPKLMNVRGCRIERRLPPRVSQYPNKGNSIYELLYSVAHNCMLAGGGSGAGLIDMETGKLLALHFGSLQVPSTGARLNIATHAMHLHQFLAGEKLKLP